MLNSAQSEDCRNSAAADDDADDDDDDDDDGGGVLESTGQHRSAGSGHNRSSIVEEAVCSSPCVNVAQVCRQSSTHDQHSLQPRTSTSARLPAPISRRGTVPLWLMLQLSYLFSPFRVASHLENVEKT